MCKVLKNFTEGKGRNLGLILEFIMRCDVKQLSHLTCAIVSRVGT
jgi:hypothetical protein